jgi:hypothetical protein
MSDMADSNRRLPSQERKKYEAANNIERAYMWLMTRHTFHDYCMQTYMATALKILS